MDEEGTVVYFETSPALESRDEQFSTEFSFSKEEAGCFKKEHPTSIPTPQSDNIWKKLNAVLTRLGRSIPNLHKEDKCRHGIAEVIRDSPLLTEEDYQLLYFVLLNPRPQQAVTHDQTRISTSTKSILAAVLVALLAVCATQFAWTTALMWTASLTLLLCSRYALIHLLSSRYEKSLECARKAVSGYCTKIESLLTLLSHCLRTIQEVEIVVRQYNRPIKGVPASHMEGGSKCYQCVGLRCKLFSGCQKMLGRLRHTTLTIIQQYPLRGELGDDVTSYLAQSPLDSLHTHITTDLATIPKEAMRGHKSLSLESLKDAANLLAVQNSELLRCLALALLDATRGEVTSLPLVRLPGMLKEVEEVVDEAREGLEWSRDFHWNHLFGQPPSRPSTSQGNRDSVPVPSTSQGNRDSIPVADLAREVHCMDLKTQAALQRIRDLGSRLTTVHDIKALACAGIYREQLTGIQCIIDAVSDHIEDGLSALHSLEHHDEGTNKAGDEGHVEDEAVDIVKESNTHPVETHNVDSCSSEDEMVFEAYVPALMADEEVGGTDSSWKVESGERQVEVSAKMVRELEDVLAVRSEKRERQREERRHRRRKKRTELEKPSDQTPSTKKEQEENIKIQSLTLATDVGPSTALKSASLQLDSLKEMELPNIQTQTAEPEEHKNTAPAEHSKNIVMGEDQAHSLESRDPIMTSGVSQLAARVAAIAAAHRGTAQTEETYGSDSSHSE